MSNTYKAVFLAILSLHALVRNSAAQEIPISPFGKNDYGDWKATGTAFQKGPASDELLTSLEIENARNNAVASSEIEGDAPTGTLTSPEFKISRRYIGFRIGGGNYEFSTCLHLLINGKIVKSATGWNSDHLAPASWDVSKFLGQTAQLQIVDAASGDWGHINVAGLVQTDSPERPPIATGPLYQEALRPQFHFTARQWTMNRLNPGQREEGWINDLNGLIYYDGEYHLFAQRWAKCWLHAVSKDLIHWTELEPAFWEESLGSGVQSGTCIIDYQNTSGLSPDPKNPPMIAFWSRFDNRAQCLNYSLDRGRTWKRYEKNPIMLTPERDPKVFWYAPGDHWVMMLYGNQQYHIFTSKNLLTWKDEQHPIPNSFECPDFFELPVDGDAKNKKWVLIQGNGNYSIGAFDGKEFKEETQRRPCDVGPNFYATQSWHNNETGDGRRIQTAWMRGADFVDMPFSQMISFPCELSLHTTPDGLRVFRKPIQEIARLHSSEDNWTNRTLGKDQTLRLAPSGQLFHIQAEVSIPERAKLTFNLRGVPVALTSTTVESGHKPIPVQGQIKKVEILIDRASVETFVNEGEVSSTRYALPKSSGLSVKAEGDAITIHSLVVHSLKSIWQSQLSVETDVNLMSKDLIMAAERGDTDYVRQLLKEGVPINARDDRGRTAIMAATHGNRPETVKQLIEAGADINLQDNMKDNPFLYAGAEGLLDILKLLIQAKADTKLTNRYGGTALIPAAEKGHVDNVRVLLTETGVNVNHINNLGWTALLEAVILSKGGTKQQQIVHLLIEHGADVNIPDKEGVTPLQHAKKRGLTEIERMLAEAGAK